MARKTIECEALEELIGDFCRRVTPDFERLRNALQIAAPNISTPTLAQYLMDLVEARSARLTSQARTISVWFWQRLTH